ncbi:hypothetical protein A4A49_04391 [Nicotiana attenuata]|uniref:Uncharacterized protein n=1 Tax=Nicotiana attenuata TaxID=49451 RepID=A0A314L417_NICAT|nr:hypothetical protein A4A49_04391 [Nicotiana attenuata]
MIETSNSLMSKQEEYNFCSSATSKELHRRKSNSPTNSNSTQRSNSSGIKLRGKEGQIKAGTDKFEARQQQNQQKHSFDFMVEKQNFKDPTINADEQRLSAQEKLIVYFFNF